MTSPELIVVMPVHNEQASIRKVVTEWLEELKNWTEDFVFLIIDDGSTDETLKILQECQSLPGSRLEILSRENKGHGQTCIEGYRIAGERNATFVLQIDSDGQCDPQYFFKFWNARNNHDVIYGNRIHRKDGWRRKLASLFLKIFLLLATRTYCIDANTPYRLMRTGILPDKINRIPGNFFLANVLLAVLLKQDKSISHHSIPITFQERYGGEPKVKLRQFGIKAIELYFQFQKIR